MQIWKGQKGIRGPGGSLPFPSLSLTSFSFLGAGAVLSSSGQEQSEKALALPHRRGGRGRLPQGEGSKKSAGKENRTGQPHHTHTGKSEGQNIEQFNILTFDVVISGKSCIMKSQGVDMREYITATQPATQAAFSEELFTRFIEYLDVKSTTLSGYQTALRAFLSWLKKEGITAPTREDVKAYKTFLETAVSSAGTRHRYLRIVKQLFRWTASEGLYPNIAESVKAAKVRNDNTKKEALSEADIRAVIDSINDSTLQGKRDKAMILLSVTGGLRCCELQRADIGDLQMIKGQRVLYIQGKGHDSKDDYVKIIAEVEEALDLYLEERGELKRNAPLFAGTSNNGYGKRLSIQSISTAIKKVLQAAGFDCEKLTAHSLRHTSNTLLFKAGADLVQVQKHARHSDPRTTEIYLHANDREKDRSEAQIYSQIYNPERNVLLGQCTELLQGLSAEELIKAEALLRELKDNKERTFRKAE